MARSGFRKHNIYEDRGAYIIGYTSNKNTKFIVDKEDFNKIKQYTWAEDAYGYIYTSENGKRIKLHKFLMNTNQIVDHINRDKKDNRRDNLRCATKQENNRNHKVRKDSVSGISGVVWMKDNKNWSAVIYINRKTIRCGSYGNIDDAIKARLNAEVKYFGEFAPQKHLFEQYGINIEEYNE